MNILKNIDLREIFRVRKIAASVAALSLVGAALAAGLGASGSASAMSLESSTTSRQAHVLAWRSVQRIAHRAAVRHHPAVGRKVALKLRSRMAPQVRRQVTVSRVAKRSLTVTALSYQRCVKWPAHRPAKATVTRGSCTSPASAPTTQPSAGKTGTPVTPVATTPSAPATTPSAPSAPVTTPSAPVTTPAAPSTGGSGGTPPVDSAPGTPRLGVYAGGTSGDDAAKSLFGRYAAISSSYYQPNTPGLKVSAEEARMDKGIAPAITLTSKGTQYLADVANKSGPGWTWVQTYVSALNTLGKYAKTKGLPLYATLDHEWEAKVNHNTLTGTSATTGVYAKALSNFFALCNADAPDVTTLYWYAGSDTTKINAIGSGLTTAPDMFSLDPYSSTSHATTETFEGLVKPKLTWLKSQSWYKGQPIGLTEFGADHSDADMAPFYSNLPEHLKNLGLAFGIFFNRTDEPYVVTLDQSSYPKSVSAVKQSLGEQ